MKKILPLIFVVTSLTVAQEVSVYGGSRTNNSYGLTSTEKHILKNQSSISSLSSKLSEINDLVNSLSKKLEGLESTYEGDSIKLNSTVLKVDEISQKLNLSSDLASNATQSSNLNQNDISALRNTVNKLANLVNKINSEYVSSSELEKNMQQFITREEFEALKKALNIKTTQSSAKLESKQENRSVQFPSLKTSEERAKFMTEAKKDFSSKMYNNAIPKFEKLVELNYKPAESNFYLGEMWFKRKKYDISITHFKKSAMLNDKASYMPTLLLHSAIAFENIKDKENATNFYSTLIELYPNTQEAKEAKKNLSKL